METTLSARLAMVMLLPMRPFFFHSSISSWISKVPWTYSKRRPASSPFMPFCSNTPCRTALAPSSPAFFDSSSTFSRSRTAALSLSAASLSLGSLTFTFPMAFWWSS